MTLDSALVNVVSANTVSSTRSREGVLEAGTSDYNQVMNNIFTVPSQPVVLIGLHSIQSGNQIHVP